MRVKGTTEDGSNSPVRIRIVNTLVSALSITPLLKIPAFIASRIFEIVYSSPVQFRLVPALKAKACPPASPETVSFVCELTQIILLLYSSGTHPGGAQK